MSNNLNYSNSRTFHIQTSEIIAYYFILEVISIRNVRCKRVYIASQLFRSLLARTPIGFRWLCNASRTEAPLRCTHHPLACIEPSADRDRPRNGNYNDCLRVGRSWIASKRRRKLIARVYPEFNRCSFFGFSFAVPRAFPVRLAVVPGRFYPPALFSWRICGESVDALLLFVA